MERFTIWRMKENLQNPFPQILFTGLMQSMESMLGSRRRSKKEISVLHWCFRNNCLSPSSSRTFRTQSYWSFIAGQCCDSEQILPTYLPYVGCAFNLHSIINKGLIPGGSEFKQETDSILFALLISETKSHKDPEKIDLNVSRRAQYLHNAWKKHQDAVYWVDINLAIRKGLTFYQTRSNAIILQGTLPACCIPKVVRLKNWRSLIWEIIHVTSTSAKDLTNVTIGQKNWVSKVDRQPAREGVARQPREEVARQAKFIQPTQPIPNPNSWSIRATW